MRGEYGLWPRAFGIAQSQIKVHIFKYAQSHNLLYLPSTTLLHRILDAALAVSHLLGNQRLRAICGCPGAVRGAGFRLDSPGEEVLTQPLGEAEPSTALVQIPRFI